MVSVCVGLLSAILAHTLKLLTEHTEHIIYNKVQSFNPILFILLPSIGITSIYFLRKYLFKGRKNKGITEIYKTLEQRNEHLPFFKIPSHTINGFLTVVFGGSTGIEVSTVVATATVGNTVHENAFSARMYKREIICAGVTAGVAVLFSSPLAGWLFAMEVVARKFRTSLIISCSAGALVAWLIISISDTGSLFPFVVKEWHWKALPLFVLLSLLGGLLSVYFTFLVTRMKKLFNSIHSNFLRVNIGAISVGCMIFIFPSLYGDSYHGMVQALTTEALPVFSLLLITLLKPLAASLTLGAGGDGGVFAPSIVAGAFLGLLFAILCNKYAGTSIIPINSALVGAVATLSGSIFAPLTSIILICNIVPNGYILFLPLLLASFTAKFFAKRILPYNVYTYDMYLTKKSG